MAAETIYTEERKKTRGPKRRLGAVGRACGKEKEVVPFYCKVDIRGTQMGKSRLYYWHSTQDSLTVHFLLLSSLTAALSWPCSTPDPRENEHQLSVKLDAVSLYAPHLSPS